MNAIVLPRIDLPAVDLSHLKNVLERASNYLSYNHVNFEVAESRLISCLRSLDIMPYDPVVVEDYKRSQTRKARLKKYGALSFIPFYGNTLRWRVCRFASFSEAIPASILEKSIEIQKNLDAGGQIRVAYLSDQDMEEKYARSLDPFIVVRSHGDRPWHHVMVWDEPTFQG